MSQAVHVVAGAGQAAAHAAVAMREAGFTGRILLIGEERHRPYERPPLSKEVLTAEPEPPVAYFRVGSRQRSLAFKIELGPQDLTMRLSPLSTERATT